LYAPIDITLVQYAPSQSSIVAYALNKTMLLNDLELIADKLHFSAHTIQDPLAINTWKEEFEIEKITFDKCNETANVLQKPLENVFGMIRYSNFLNQYKELSENESEQQAMQKYNIILP